MFQTKRNAPEPPQDTDPNLVFSPDSKTYKSVREKSASKPRKNLRRSMSVGEGSRKTVHKSAYNEEQSSKYNVVTNVKAEEVRMSVNEKIQVFSPCVSSVLYGCYQN